MSVALGDQNYHRHTVVHHAIGRCWKEVKRCHITPTTTHPIKTTKPKPMSSWAIITLRL